MKPEIVTLRSEGWHNDDPMAVHRMEESQQWRRNRIIVLIPAAAVIPARVYLSHVGLIFPPNNHVHRMLCQGMEVGAAYSAGIEMALANPELREWEWVLTIEHDNAPPPDGLLKLIASMNKHPEFSAISGLYWTKGEGGVPQIWGDVKDPLLNFRPQVPRPGEVQECYGLGMGFVLYRLSMFRDERLRRPWFKTEASAEGVGTQDLYFWTDARKYGYRCAVDNNVRVGHWDDARGFMW